MNVDRKLSAINQAGTFPADSEALRAAASTILAAHAYASAHVAFQTAPADSDNEGSLWKAVQRTRAALLKECGHA